ncbi:MAG: M28 family peptidase [Bacteroidetes bacterium]|nr:M28 family peptidase [Bacteroidota bacterium]
MGNKRFKQIKIRIICLFFFTTLLSVFSGCSRGNTEKAMSSISHENLIESVNYLSSGELKGRLAGSDSYNIAAEYVADLFKKYNLEPLGDSGYFQYFSIEHNDLNTSKLSVVFNEKEKEYKFGSDYVCRGMTESQYTKSKQTMNIVGIQYGSHPKLKDEYIVVGAHLDHVGAQANEIFFPGANDNASGIAVILEIAKVFNKFKLQPE